MIPSSLALPVDVRPWPRPGRARRLRWLALGAAVASVLLGVMWAAAWSPLGYERFSVFDAGREVSLRRGGEITVFEEFRDAGSPRLPTPVAVRVLGPDGEELPVEPALAPGERGAPDAYELFGVEGRALARFTADEGGDHLVAVTFLPGEAGRYRPFESVTLAVGRTAPAPWLAGPLGAVVLVGVPAAVAVALGVAAAIVARADRRSTASLTTRRR